MQKKYRKGKKFLLLNKYSDIINNKLFIKENEKT